ncbi:uncharacterized membrane-anchored protein YjiN (DUF445 family) [Aneurinibacillus soli]|uniref:Uncharacterized protein n=1 Tax=Aneurinibacillus soli TaxID=1500254 RepID=A0A0U5B917_9BACL|nr:DUF445 domain-containing protein [Aneurinibacillus soli]PYE60355.1 uncharacterized membrane-anchored protein YjiN (DUF445 family) [Aneurinibacillus soli]BAU27245.1 hypothetical protein CB4_01414 [Aneurinibacillus soli]
MKKEAKYIAGISLGIMGAGFAATLPFHDRLVAGIINGGFEAGLVGGLADWFAVTALFRHPMGLPIPHTALLPRNRKRITDALVHTLENDWLTKESIEAKIREVHITDKLLDLLESEMKGSAFREAVQTVVVRVIHSVDTAVFVPVLAQMGRDYIRSIDAKKLLDRLIEEAVTGEYDSKLFDFAVGRASDWAVRTETKHKLGSMALSALNNLELDGFMQFALKSFAGMLNEEKLGSILQNLIVRGCDDLRRPGNKNRQAVLLYIRGELEKAGEHEGLLKTVDRAKEVILTHIDLEERIADMLARLKEKALVYVQTDAFLDGQALPLLSGLLADVKKDRELLDRLEEWTKRQLVTLIGRNHSKIGLLVRENLDKLDNETLIEMMEDKIGKDIQWIRVNGAVCGFLIGLVLAGVRALAS